MLVLDDDPEIASLATTVLGRHLTADVRTETDPSRAVERVEQEPVDCLVSDFQMPAMDGLSVCRRVRARVGVPCILFTSVDDPDLLARVREAGFGYVHKAGGTEPYERLADRVERLVARTAGRPDPA